MSDERVAEASRPEERYVDPVIEVYKKDVDRTLIREMLRMSPEQRLESLERSLRDLAELQQAVIAAQTR